MSRAESKTKRVKSQLVDESYGVGYGPAGRPKDLETRPMARSDAYRITEIKEKDNGLAWAQGKSGAVRRIYSSLGEETVGDLPEVLNLHTGMKIGDSEEAFDVTNGRILRNIGGIRGGDLRRQ